MGEYVPTNSLCFSILIKVPSIRWQLMLLLLAAALSRYVLTITTFGSQVHKESLSKKSYPCFDRSCSNIFFAWFLVLISHNLVLISYNYFSFLWNRCLPLLLIQSSVADFIPTSYEHQRLRLCNVSVEMIFAFVLFVFFTPNLSHQLKHSFFSLCWLVLAVFPNYFLSVPCVQRFLQGCLCPAS